MTTAADHYETLLAEHYTWMLGGDLSALAADQERLLGGLGLVPDGSGTTAVDLGCGPGHQALALAALGYTRVIAVDTSQPLLDELALYATDIAAIRPTLGDLRTVLPRITEPGSVSAVVCMGDTLTHLPAKEDVTALLGDISRALTPGGSLVITHRDLTTPLHGTDRFIPVRSTADRILTCFLEYRDEDTVIVHDLLHLRTGDGWTLQAGSYPKLRIAADWLADQCRRAGLEIRHNETGPRGMRVLHVTRSPETPSS